MYIMDALVECDLENSEDFLRKNLEEAEEELLFEPCIHTIKIPKKSPYRNLISPINIHDCTTIRITTETNEIDEIDIIRILTMSITNSKTTVILLRLFHLGYIDTSCNEIVIRIPKYIAKHARFNYVELSNESTIELSKTYDYTLDDEHNHNITYSLFIIQYYSITMGYSIYAPHSLYNLIIYVSKIDVYIYNNEEIDHENIPLYLNIYCESSDVLLAVVPYDELIVSESYNITCYECNIAKIVGKYMGTIRIDIPYASAFRTYVYGERLNEMMLVK